MVTSAYNAVHHYLKLATAAAHSSLECVLAKRGYFEGREQYIQYLQRFLAFQNEAERALDTPLTIESIPDWNERRRAHLARADVAALGAQESDFSQSAGRFPQVVTCEQVLGIAYVVEGSTLGGAYLLKQLAPLGINAAHGGSYLASYGQNRSKMWQRFLFTLEAAHLRHARVEAIAGAALTTFAAARYYLTEAAEVSAARARSMVA